MQPCKVGCKHLQWVILETSRDICTSGQCESCNADIPGALFQLRSPDFTVWTITCSPSTVPWPRHRRRPSGSTSPATTGISETLLLSRAFMTDVPCCDYCVSFFFLFPGAGRRRGVDWRRLTEAASAPFTSPAWCLMRAAWRSSTTSRALICRSVAARMQPPAGCWSKNTHLRTTVGSVCVCVHAVSAQVCLFMNVPS